MTRIELLELHRKVRAKEPLTDPERQSLFEAAFVGHHVLACVDAHCPNRPRPLILQRRVVQIDPLRMLRAVIEGLDETPDALGDG